MKTIQIPGAVITIIEEDNFSSKTTTKRGYYPAQVRQRLSSHEEARRIEKERQGQALGPMFHVDNAKRHRPERGGVRFIGT